MPTQYQTRPPYGNCVMLSPDGIILCRCDLKRAQWYLLRKLAHVVQVQPFTIQLDFVPKGNGHADYPYYITEKKNICVCCGKDSRLTKHHCVPRCFRRFLPDEYKNHSCHDVVLLCVDCHSRYEPYAEELKIKLADQYGIVRRMPMQSNQIELNSILKAVRALMRHREHIPPARICELERQIKTHLKKDALTEDDLFYLDSQDARHRVVQAEEDAFGKHVAACIKDVSEFAKMWRQHFVSIMSPQFLPAFWDVNHNEVESR